jgi:hypothetical protein
MQSARHDERLLPAGILTSYPHHDDAVRRVPTSQAGNPGDGIRCRRSARPLLEKREKGRTHICSLPTFPNAGLYSPQMMATRREVAHPQLFRSMLKDKPALYFPR